MLASKNKETSFCVFKPTGIGRFAIFQKKSEEIELT